MAPRPVRLLQGLYGGGVAIYLASVLSPADALPVLRGLFLGTVTIPLLRASPYTLALAGVAAMSAAVVFLMAPRGRLRFLLAAGALLSWAPVLLVCLRLASGWAPGTAPGRPVAIEPGGAYLADEVEPKAALGSFGGLLEKGYRGLAVTGTNPAQLPEGVRGAVCYWLTDVHGENTINPVEMEKIQWRVDEFLQEGPGPHAILLDCLGTIAARNGFTPALKLGQSLRDTVASRGAVLLLSVDLRALGPEEGAQLQQGMRRLV